MNPTHTEKMRADSRKATHGSSPAMGVVTGEPLDVSNSLSGTSIARASSATQRRSSRASGSCVTLCRVAAKRRYGVGSAATVAARVSRRVLLRGNVGGELGDDADEEDDVSREASHCAMVVLSSDDLSVSCVVSGKARCSASSSALLRA